QALELQPREMARRRLEGLAAVPARIGEDARRALGPRHRRHGRQVREDQRVGEVPLLEVARPGRDAALHGEAEEAAQEVQAVLREVAEVAQRDRLAPTEAVQVRLLEADVLELLGGKTLFDSLDRLHRVLLMTPIRPGPPAAAVRRARPAGPQRR